MQTFLPYASFEQTARILDKPRLIKQRVECLQIYNALIDPEYGWQNHPAVNQWREYEGALLLYALAISFECEQRNVADHKGLGDFFEDEITMIKSVDLPAWVHDERVHLSHKSNLYRKDSEYYFFWGDIGPDVPYYWPSKDPKTEFYVPTKAELKRMNLNQR